jgi:hypothetical protein
MRGKPIIFCYLVVKCANSPTNYASCEYRWRSARRCAAKPLLLSFLPLARGISSTPCLIGSGKRPNRFFLLFFCNFFFCHPMFDMLRELPYTHYVRLVLCMYLYVCIYRCYINIHMYAIGAVYMYIYMYKSVRTFLFFCFYCECFNCFFFWQLLR